MTSRPTSPKSGWPRSMASASCAMRENLGFVGSCNAGAAIARGEFVLFLNNDTVVTAGWLEALLRVFDEEPDAGLVGARLVYPDGRLQEAGGIIFSDGSGWNYGRFEDPEDSRLRVPSRSRLLLGRGDHAATRPVRAARALRSTLCAGLLRGYRPRLCRARGRDSRSTTNRARASSTSKASPPAPIPAAA